MTRDYAKRTSKKRNKSKNKSLSYFLLWIATIAIFVSFTAGLVYLGKHRHQFHRQAKIKILHANIHNSAQQNTTTPISNMPQFDFYSLLQQNKDTVVTSGYELDITPLVDSITADNLKTNLTLLGYSVNAVLLPGKIATRYRVIIGPYDNKSSALNDQKKLKEKNFHTFLRKAQQTIN